MNKASKEVHRPGSEREDEEDSARFIDLTGSDDGEDEAQTSCEAGRLTDKENSRGSRDPNAGCLLPGTYEIILCVDVIETTG